jgi:PIN domain nuclease of toxin-antitoxin system
MRAPSLLLDTCAAIWILENAELSDAAVKAMDEAADAEAPVFVSPITAWEVGLLSLRGRFRTTLDPHRWFENLMAVPGIRLAPMPPETLIASSRIPDGPLRDPADRIIAATAREHDYTVVTRDRPLLSYADAGHLRALAC